MESENELTLEAVTSYKYVTPDTFEWDPEQQKHTNKDGKDVLNTGSFDTQNFNMYINKEFREYPSGFDYKQIVRVVRFASELERMVYLYRNLKNGQYLKLPVNPKKIEVLHRYFGKNVIQHYGDLFIQKINKKLQNLND